MKINVNYRIKAILDITVGLFPKSPGKYIVLDADYNIFIKRCELYALGDFKSRFDQADG